MIKACTKQRDDFKTVARDLHIFGGIPNTAFDGMDESLMGQVAVGIFGSVLDIAFFFALSARLHVRF